MKLPSPVKKVKDELETLEKNHSRKSADGLPEKFSDERLNIIKLLTAPHKPKNIKPSNSGGGTAREKEKMFFYAEDYEKMWEDIFNLRYKADHEDECKWVYDLINDITYAKKIPEYLTLNKKARDHLLYKTSEHTTALKRIYEDNYPNDRLLCGFEQYNENGEQFDNPLTIVDYLDSLYETLKHDLEFFNREGNASNRIKCRLFLEKFARRNRDFSDFIFRVLIFAIYKEYYETPAIIKRLKKSEIFRENSK